MTKRGLYCPAGQFYIDPSGVSLLKARIGGKIHVTDYGYGELFELNGEVWVASGDYKREKDPDQLTLF